MHDILYENQQALEDENLLEYAEILKLNMSRFQNDFYNHNFAGLIREDFLSGVRSGVNGTPTFYINSMRYNHSWDQETLTRTLIDIINENL